jgi:hypothetical protein
MYPAVLGIKIQQHPNNLATSDESGKLFRMFLIAISANEDARLLSLIRIGRLQSRFRIRHRRGSGVELQSGSFVEP